METWAASDPENRKTLEELQSVWERVSRQQNTLPIDVDGLWDELSERIREAEDEPFVQEHATRERGRSPSRRGTSRSKASRRRLLSGAVSIAVVAAIALVVFLFEGRPRSTETSEKKVFTTQRGQRATIRLTDGTQVRLNVESRLTVLPSFGKKAREVRLRGEAFFEVAKDSTRPFTVRADEAVTRVLGTSFGVNAYPEENVTSVVVTEGRVSVRPEQSPDTQKATRDLVLEKQELGQIHRTGQHEVHRTSDLTAHLAWMDGKLVFEDAAFGEVAQKLERWYGIETSLRGGMSPPDGSFNARFAEDQPLPEVLDLVSTVFGLEYQLKQKTAIFAPAE